MIQEGTILPAKEYNEKMTQKWEQDSKAHWQKHNGDGQIKDYSDFAAAQQQAPQLAFYVFSNTRGELRKSGYVLKTNRGAQWFRLKRDAEKEKRFKNL